MRSKFSSEGQERRNRYFKVCRGHEIFDDLKIHENMASPALEMIKFVNFAMRSRAMILKPTEHDS